MTPERARAASRRARFMSCVCYGLATVAMVLTYGYGLWQLSSFVLVMLGLRYTIDANAAWWWARGYEDASRVALLGRFWIVDDPRPDGDDH